MSNNMNETAMHNRYGAEQDSNEKEPFTTHLSCARQFGGHGNGRRRNLVRAEVFCAILG